MKTEESLYCLRTSTSVCMMVCAELKHVVRPQTLMPSERHKKWRVFCTKDHSQVVAWQNFCCHALLEGKKPLDSFCLIEDFCLSNSTGQSILIINLFFFLALSQLKSRYLCLPLSYMAHSINPVHKSRKCTDILTSFNKLYILVPTISLLICITNCGLLV